MSKEDKYWEYDEIEENYKLHFTRFYEDEIIATVFEDEDFSQYFPLVNLLLMLKKIAALFLVLWPIFFIVELIIETFMFLERIFRCES